VIGVNLRGVARAIAAMFDTRAGIACLTLAGTLLAGMGVAAADGSRSDCPRVADVTAKLDQLLVRGVRADSIAQKIVIRDRGPSWDIDVAGHSASYADPARDCPERVRVATVFAALALEPPDREPPAEVGVLAPKTGAPPTTVQQGLELAPELVLGLRDGDTATTWGGALRWQISGARLGLTAGLNGAMPAVFRAGAYEASLARMIVDVSPRVRLLAGSASFSLELGPFAGLLFSRGRNLSPGGSATSVDAGARVAVRVELARRKLSPFLAAQGELSVRRFRMLVEPSGDVGSAPRVWLALLVGAAVGL
jgi:hypothetical protein